MCSLQEHIQREIRAREEAKQQEASDELSRHAGE